MGGCCVLTTVKAFRKGRRVRWSEGGTSPASYEDPISAAAVATHFSGYSKAKVLSATHLIAV